jgi:hypothetical protein
MKPALIVWEDACDLDSTPWAEHDESYIYEPVLVTQVGYILYDGEEGIVLTNAYYDEIVGRRSQIPRGMIRSITYLDI